MSTEKTLEAGLAYLCRWDVASFDAYVINALERVPVPGMGTFAVGPLGNRYALYYDPDAKEFQSMKELIATLRHEVLHIVLNHTPRLYQLLQLAETEEARERIHAVRGIAADAAVNELLRETEPLIAAPDKPLGFWVLAENFGLPNKGGYEQYMLPLLQKQRADKERADRIQARVRELLLEYVATLPESTPYEEGSLYAQLREELKKNAAA